MWLHALQGLPLILIHGTGDSFSCKSQGQSAPIDQGDSY